MGSLFTSIFILLILFSWLVLSFLPWLFKSLFSVGHAGYRLLFFCLLFGILVGLVILLVINTMSGLGWSFLGTVLSSSIVLLSPRLLQKSKNR